MFTTIVVPLDSGSLAEQALPLALKLASFARTQIILVHIAKLPLFLDDYAQEELEAVRKAQTYLERLKRRLTEPGFADYPIKPDQLKIVLGYGEPIQEILRVITALKADLIVMSTHGRNEIAQLIQGSVAKHIVQHSHLPIIWVRPSKVAHSELFSKHAPMTANNPLTMVNAVGPIVITLDGTKEAEQALAPAMMIARQLKTSIKLLNVAASVVPHHSGAAGLDYMHNLFDAEIITRQLNNQIGQYLTSLEKSITAQNLVCTGITRAGDPVDEIVAYALEVQASLVVMVSHSRNKKGLSISIAEQVMRQTYLPVMMVYPVAPRIETSADATAV